MTKEEIAKILKQLRIDSGLTQKEAAEAIGRKQQTLASWETGQSQPDANTLFILCRKYGTTVDSAFGFEGNAPIVQSEMAILKKYRSLDDYGKEAINAILDIEYHRCEDSSSSADISKEELDRLVEEALNERAQTAG